MNTSENIVETLLDPGSTLPLPAFYEQRDKIDVVLTRSEQVSSVMVQEV